MIKLLRKTTKGQSKYLQTKSITTATLLGVDYIKQSVERGHRNLKRNRILKGKEDKPPSISVKFLSWKDSNNILNSIIKQNKENNHSTIKVAQQFSKGTTDRRNEALGKRKELMKTNKNTDYKIVYPAVLMSRIKNMNGNFNIVKRY